MTRKLAEAEIAARLPEVAGWAHRDGALRRDFEFADFVAAFGFMTRVALLAEAAGHHPDWSNVYRTVRIALSTHDAGGVTDLDFDLAAKIARLADARREGT